MAKERGLSEAEREVLKVLWDQGPGTVRAINEELERRGRHWAYTTVATLLQRLAAKRFLVSDPSAIPHVYRATVSRDELLERARLLRDLALDRAHARRRSSALASTSSTSSPET